MSETEDDDGGIDKEALREELREKYERDKRDREATQRMSDLLLKGATMTNTHCGTCGDPLFQQDGTTFCPTCHGGPGGVEASIEEATGEDSATGVAADETPTEAGEPADEDQTREDGPGEDRPTAAADADRDSRSAGGDARSFEKAESPANPTAGREPVDRGPSGAGVDGRPGPGDDTVRLGAGDDTRPVPSARDSDGDLGDARDSLVAALERFAAEAGETDDPRYARECLQAAREAAEALATLRR